MSRGYSLINPERPAGPSLRDALDASVKQARGKDIIDIGGEIAIAAQDAERAGCDLMSDMYANEPKLIATARRAAIRILTACAQFEPEQADTDPISLTHGA